MTKLFLLVAVLLLFSGMAFAQYPPLICPPYCAAPSPGPWYCDFAPWLKGCQTAAHQAKPVSFVLEVKPEITIAPLPELLAPSTVDVDRPQPFKPARDQL